MAAQDKLPTVVCLVAVPLTVPQEPPKPGEAQRVCMRRAQWTFVGQLTMGVIGDTDDTAPFSSSSLGLTGGRRSIPLFQRATQEMKESCGIFTGSRSQLANS